MISEATQKEIEAAGLSFILGMKIPRVPCVSHWIENQTGWSIRNDRCHPFTWTKTAEELLPNGKPGKRTTRC